MWVSLTAETVLIAVLGLKDYRPLYRLLLIFTVFTHQ